MGDHKTTPERQAQTSSELALLAQRNVDDDIRQAARAVYTKYGNNLSAFWRDAFAAEAQRHGDNSDPHVVDGNCIHSIPICRQCQIAAVEIHLREKNEILTAPLNNTHWQFRAGAEDTMCGLRVVDVPSSLLTDVVTCWACRAAFCGYNLGRAGVATTGSARNCSKQTTCV
jgi:hypothetical protein